MIDLAVYVANCVRKQNKIFTRLKYMQQNRRSHLYCNWNLHEKAISFVNVSYDEAAGYYFSLRGRKFIGRSMFCWREQGESSLRRPHVTVQRPKQLTSYKCIIISAFIISDFFVRIKAVGPCVRYTNPKYTRTYHNKQLLHTPYSCNLVKNGNATNYKYSKLPELPCT